MESACRVCASSNAKLMDIFGKMDNQDHLCLSDMLIDCFNCSLHPEDPFPNEICFTCALATQHIYKFKRKYEESHQHFCRLLDTTTKLMIVETKGATNMEIKLESTEKAEEEEDPQGRNAVEVEEEVAEEEDESMQRLYLEEEEAMSGECDAIIKEETMLMETSVKIEDTKIYNYAEGIIFTSLVPGCCDTCGDSFENNTKLILHTLEHYNLDLNICPYCPNMFLNRASLRRHVVIHSGEKLYKCPHCSEDFLHKKTLQRHVFHHRIESTFNCVHCKLAFEKNWQLLDHKRTHTPYKCRSCPKSFRSNTTLKKHVRLHSVVRPLKCPHCPNRFFVDNQLQVHIAWHLNEREFKCNECQKTFNNIGQLNNHKRLKHLVETEKIVKEIKTYSLRTRRSVTTSM